MTVIGIKQVTASANHKRVAKFLLAGSAAALTEYGFFIVFRTLGMAILLANSLSFLCGLAVSFSANKMWVFSARGNTRRQFTLYFILAMVNLGISNLLVWILTVVVGTWPLLAKLITMVFIAIWNYAFFSKLIFKERHLDA